MWGALTVAVIVLGGTFAAIYIGVRLERARIVSATETEKERIIKAVDDVKTIVAGMDDEELDAAVYGPVADKLHSGPDHQRGGK